MPSRALPRCSNFPTGVCDPRHSSPKGRLQLHGRRRRHKAKMRCTPPSARAVLSQTPKQRCSKQNRRLQQCCLRSKGKSHAGRPPSAPHVVLLLPLPPVSPAGNWVRVVGLRGRSDQDPRTRRSCMAPCSARGAHTCRRRAAPQSGADRCAPIQPAATEHAAHPRGRKTTRSLSAGGRRCWPAPSACAAWAGSAIAAIAGEGDPAAACCAPCAVPGLIAFARPAMRARSGRCVSIAGGGPNAMAERGGSNLLRP